MLPGRTDYQISRSERTHLPLNLSQMSSDTEDSDGLGMSGACKEITSLGKHANKTSKDSRREEDQVDVTRNDTGLALLTTTQHAIIRTK